MSIAPVLVLGYRRPDMLSELLSVLPHDRRVYIHIDGPTLHTESEVKSSIEVVKKFREERGLDLVAAKAQSKNIGNRLAFRHAMNWVFSVEDRVIVLEDDIRFGSNFFAFMDWALRRFENEDRIFHVNGLSMIDFIPGRNRLYESYSLKPWGFGTWKSSWDKYLQMNQNPTSQSIESLPIFKEVSLTQSFTDKWNDRLRRFNEGTDTYDVGWNYCAWLNNSVAISPRFTLTTNIGFDSRSLHTHVRPFVLRSPKKIKTKGYDFNKVQVASFPSFYDAYSDFLEWRTPGIKIGSIRFFIFVHKILVTLKRKILQKEQ
jgi:hypothetical protein